MRRLALACALWLTGTGAGAQTAADTAAHPVASALPPRTALGRLFYSEDERSRLEARRNAAVAEHDIPRTVGALKLDGVVTRSSGRGTWFINGTAADPDALARLPGRAEHGVLQLQGADGRPLRLKPGERAAISEGGHASTDGPVIDIRPGRSR